MSDQKKPVKRDAWSSKVGVIFAVSASAVGLGNLLIFPGTAAKNGGGAFLIPYFCALIFLGIPLCWAEWTLGRMSGRFGHGSAPGAFNALWKWPAAKYLGVLGILGPLFIFFYYAYLEAWTLGYAFNATLGKFNGVTDKNVLNTMLSDFKNFTGFGEGKSGIPPAYWFFLITFAINFYIIYRGIAKGIEFVSKVALPILAILGVILCVRVLTLGAPVTAHPEYNVLSGLGFVWNPDLSRLKESGVWMAATGQVFFTLSVGSGIILTYASYMKKKSDVALSSLTACGVNTFFEIIIGGSVVIVAACMFFGTSFTVGIAGNLFDLGFVSMPRLFNEMAGGQIYCIMWFVLLFVAGVTSSISIIQPSISFLEDEFGVSRKMSVGVIGGISLFMGHLVVFGGDVMMDEMDFWGRMVIIVIFGLLEAILFAWVIGVDKGFKELHQGATIRVPSIFKFIIKYVTPLYILTVFFFYAKDMKGGFWPFLTMQKYQPSVEAAKNGATFDPTFIIITRVCLLIIVVVFCYLIYSAFKGRIEREIDTENE